VLFYTNRKEVLHKSIVLFSDCTTYDIAAVYVKQEILIYKIRKVCQKVEKIIYVTDGTKQHYKNKYQISNLMHHKEDFDTEAEWHCYVIVHSKSACDGVSITFKRETTIVNLQVHTTEPILNSADLFEWVKKKFNNIKFLNFF